MTLSVDLRERLEEQVQQLAVVDTHEHVPDEQLYYEKRRLGFFRFLEHYVSSDLVAAGLSRQALETVRSLQSDLTIADRWALIAPYWPYVRNTGYGRAMREFMRDLFDVEDIDEQSVRILSKRIEEAHRPGWYRTVLKEKANIAASLVIRWPGEPVAVDKAFFRAVPILDHFSMPSTRADLEELERQSGMAIQTLDQLMAAQEAMLDRFVADGIVAVKIFLAYRRTLFFDRVDKGTATRVFDRVWLSQPLDLDADDMKPLEDFMTHRLVGLATDRGLPIQIHTGLQEGNGNYLENSRPTHLTNLFMAFGDARFVLFHAGYPYTGELIALAKNFANVYADLCWIQAVSPAAAARILDEWIETIPANKIMACGGDSNYPEGAYGHCRIARLIAANVLAAKVEDGYFSEDDARWYATRILRENAAELFGLRGI